MLLKDEAEVGTAEASAIGRCRLIALATFIACRGVLARYKGNQNYNSSVILKESCRYFTFGLGTLRVRAEHDAIRRVGCSS